MMENKSDDDYVVDEEEEESGNDSDSDIEESQVDGMIHPTQNLKRNLYMAYADAGAQEENAVKNKKKKN